jgi:hypothetical protein
MDLPCITRETIVTSRALNSITGHDFTSPTRPEGSGAADVITDVDIELAPTRRTFRKETGRITNFQTVKLIPHKDV